MKKISVVFIAENKWYHKIIQFIEKIGSHNFKPSYIPSHVGIEVDGHFREAMASGFVESNLSTKYGDIQIYDLYVMSDYNISRGDEAFQKYWGVKYGWKALLNGFIYSIFNINVMGDGDRTMDCSEVVTRILRAYGFYICNSIHADNITPLILYNEVRRIGSRRLIE